MIRKLSEVWPIVERIGRERGAIRVGASNLDDEHAALFAQWLDQGHHATMDYLAKNRDVRRDPSSRFPWAKSAIVILVPYSSDAARRSGAGALESHRPLRARRRLSRGARSHPARDRRRASWRCEDVALRRHGPALRSRSGGAGRTGLDRQERHADRRRDRLVRFHRHAAHVARERHRGGDGRRSLRHLHALHRRVSDECDPAESHHRVGALHQLRDDRASRPAPRDHARRQRVRLRHLPGSLPVERASRRSASRIRGAQRVPRNAADRSSPLRAVRFLAPLPQQRHQAREARRNEAQRGLWGGGGGGG